VLSLQLPSRPLSLACIAAHPDDVEIACGGTLLELATRGEVSVHWLTFTGDTGRAAEAVAAAEASHLQLPNFMSFPMAVCLHIGMQ
jgi:LmbE family N-acetylglucosaminyl deacetylase